MMNHRMVTLLLSVLMLAAPLAGCLDDAEVITTNDTNDDTLMGNNTTTNETADNNTGNSTTMPERGNDTFSCEALTCGCDPRLCDEDNNTIVRDWDNMTEEDWCNWNGNEWHTWTDENNNTTGACAVICFPEPIDRPISGNNTTTEWFRFWTNGTNETFLHITNGSSNWTYVTVTMNNMTYNMTYEEVMSLNTTGMADGRYMANITLYEGNQTVMEMETWVAFDDGEMIVGYFSDTTETETVDTTE